MSVVYKDPSLALCYSSLNGLRAVHSQAPLALKAGSPAVVGEFLSLLFSGLSDFSATKHCLEQQLSPLSPTPGQVSPPGAMGSLPAHQPTDLSCCLGLLKQA